MEFEKSFISGLGSSAASTGLGFIGNALSQALGLSYERARSL